MSCNDIPSLLDLQKAKLNADDFGRLMGTGTGTSTNGVTGQVRLTYNKVINDMNSEFDGMISDMNSEFDGQILNMGFTHIGTFASGATITNPRQTLLWDVADGGDGQEYGWSGSFPPAGKVVPPGSTPLTTGGIAVGSWISRFDPALRVQTREALRRSYAEAGYSVVGTFQAGFTLVNPNDVGIDETTGKGFTGPSGEVLPGTDPIGVGFVDRSGEVIRNQLSTSVLKLIGARFALRDVISLMDYATGDGVSDDIAAMDQAVAAAPNGAIIISPPGKTYAISRTWEVNKSNLKICLYGAKIVPIAGANREIAFNAVTIGTTSGAICEGVEFSAAEIDGATGGFDSGVRAQGVRRCYIRDNYIHDVGNPIANTKEAGFGIMSVGRSTSELNEDVFVTGNVIKNIGGKGNLAGDFVYISYTNGIIVDGNKGFSCPRMGISLTSYVTNAKIVNNYLSDINLAAIDLESNVKVNDLSQVYIAGNTLTRFGKKPSSGYVGGQFFGIDIHDTVNRVVIIGNIITDGDPDAIGNATTAIFGINNAKDVLISGNFITGVNKILTNLAGNAMRVLTITGNICYAKDSGIELAESPDASITGNRIVVSGNGYPIKISTSTLTPTIITGNRLKTGGVCAARINQSSLTTMTGNTLEVGTLAAPDADTVSMVRVRNSGAVTVHHTITDNTFIGNGSSTAIECARLTGAVQRIIARDNNFVAGITTKIVGMDSNAHADLGGVQVQAPNGSLWAIKVDNAGVVSATSIT